MASESGDYDYMEPGEDQLNTQLGSNEYETPTYTPGNAYEYITDGTPQSVSDIKNTTPSSAKQNITGQEVPAKLKPHTPFKRICCLKVVIPIIVTILMIGIGVVLLVVLIFQRTTANRDDKVAGGWSSWSNWGQCNATCGNGSHVRFRNCTISAPQDGGADCVEDGLETQACDTRITCNVSAGWGSWSNWGQCNVTCGKGSHVRVRKCTNPVPQGGSADCVRGGLEAQACDTGITCKVDGGWSSWSNWGQCNVTCEKGSHERFRKCTNPVPQDGGADCVGDSLEAQACDTGITCKVDGVWSSWSNWGQCNSTCGKGSRERFRKCTSPVPRGGGADCVGDGLEAQACDTGITCKVVGGWSSWSNWGHCNATCGKGYRVIFRKCTNPVPQGGGADCVGNHLEAQACDTRISCKVAGGWSLWSNWEQCSATCGKGSHVLFRKCTNPVPQSGGAYCVGDHLETRVCDTGITCRADGGWSSWSNWGQCSATCGNSSRVVFRKCTNPVPQGGGADCVGDHLETQACCTGITCKVPGGWNSWSSWGQCSVTCGMGSRVLFRKCTDPVPQGGGAYCAGNHLEAQTCDTGITCKVAGGWSSWSTWGRCSATCGTGSRVLFRRCTNPVPQHGGADCVGDQLAAQTCDTGITCKVAGGWSSWSNWGQCSATCGKGSYVRFRKCTNPVPRDGGADCAGAGLETQACCTGITCIVAGRWSSWSTWGQCSATCGMGTRVLFRRCTNPVPQGADCVGDHLKVQACDSGITCKVAGGWSSWSNWGRCSATCGMGSHVQFRKCTNPVPRDGGADCAGDHLQAQPCDTGIVCKVAGGWSLWSNWGQCSATCGKGSHERFRKCTNPVPQGGGADCVGDGLETQACCTGITCKVVGGWSSWSNWGQCSNTRGKGVHVRHRQCTNPVPKGDGAYCVGECFAVGTCDTTYSLVNNGDSKTFENDLKRLDPSGKADFG